MNVIALASVAVLALALLGVGLRGRRIDHHPLCRRCGFDLTGRPDTSARCAECGADLGRPRAIRVGNRAPRRRVASLGTALLVPALGVGGYLTWGEVQGINWQERKPVWLLSREAFGRDQKVRDAALAELLARHAKRRLTPAEVDSLIDRGLDYQADLTRGWSGDWGVFIERALAGRSRSDPRRARYAAQGLAFAIHIPAEVRPGDGAWARVLAQPRFGPGAGFHVRVTRSFRLGTSQEWRNMVPLLVRLEGSMVTRGTANWSTPMNPTAFNGLRPGPQTAQLRLELSVFDTADDVRAERLVGEARRDLVAQWELLPAGAPLTKTVP